MLDWFVFLNLCIAYNTFSKYTQKGTFLQKRGEKLANLSYTNKGNVV